MLKLRPAGRWAPSPCDTLNHMADESSVQRSFRLSATTSALLDAAAARGRESRNALVDRLVAEGLRLERHPLIRFRESRGGRRQAFVVGTRLHVYQVVSTVRASDGDVEQAASYLGVATRVVRAALDYYAEFPGEIDSDAEQGYPSPAREEMERAAGFSQVCRNTAKAQHFGVCAPDKEHTCRSATLQHRARDSSEGIACLGAQSCRAFKSNKAEDRKHQGWTQ